MGYGPPGGPPIQEGQQADADELRTHLRCLAPMDLKEECRGVDMTRQEVDVKGKNAGACLFTARKSCCEVSMAIETSKIPMRGAKLLFVCMSRLQPWLHELLAL